MHTEVGRNFIQMIVVADDRFSFSQVSQEPSNNSNFSIIFVRKNHAIAEVLPWQMVLDYTFQAIRCIYSDGYEWRIYNTLLTENMLWGFEKSIQESAPKRLCHVCWVLQNNLGCQQKWKVRGRQTLLCQGNFFRTMGRSTDML
jgi:hypothetical protein